MKKLSLILAFLATAIATQASPLWMRYPAISPNGEQIAFCDKGSIYVAPVNGGEAERITPMAHYDYNPVWSPDSKTIAFASNRYGNFDVFTVPATGGTPKRVTTNSVARSHQHSRLTARRYISQLRSLTLWSQPSSQRALCRSCMLSQPRVVAMSEYWLPQHRSYHSAVTASVSSIRIARVARMTGVSTTHHLSHATSGSTTPSQASTHSSRSGRVRTATHDLLTTTRQSTTSPSRVAHSTCGQCQPTTHLRQSR